MKNVYNDAQLIWKIIKQFFNATLHRGCCLEKPDGIYKSDSINLLFDPLEPDGSTFKSEINPRESPVCP